MLHSDVNFMAGCVMEFEDLLTSIFGGGENQQPTKRGKLPPPADPARLPKLTPAAFDAAFTIPINRNRKK